MELKQIQDLIKFVAKSGVEEVELEKGNFKITIKAKSNENNGDHSPQVIYAQPGMIPAPAAPATAAPAPAATPAAEKPAEAPEAPAASGTEIKAPMIGTFYRSPGPDKDAFVKVGDRIEKGQVVCIIEAMKLFNEIESDVSGTITKVLVDDSSPVEYDQPLFIVE
ncbi:MAG: acetyl-CoA carboxylase biotin carboxyl carrier protein [Bacteroidia bacterium]